MKNFEKNIDKIVIGSCDFIRREILKMNECTSIDCSKCRELGRKWLMEEYKPEIDWTKVPIDTTVLVRDNDDKEWLERYFVCYMPENFCPFRVFGGGLNREKATNIQGWTQCKLADGVDATPYLKEV